MKREAIEKARERLARASDAIGRLEQKEAFDTFVSDWTDFLLASNSIYTVLEQGAKTSAQSRQWFGRKKNQRRADPLLQYLHQARNADEHGLEQIIQRGEQTLNIDFKKGYRPKTGQIKMSDGTVFQLPPTPENAEGMIITLRAYALARVKDTRYGNEFDPPTEHLGKPLENPDSPLHAAKLALAYQASLIEEAERLVWRDRRRQSSCRKRP
jgi:hypothetical protein